MLLVVGLYDLAQSSCTIAHLFGLLLHNVEVIPALLFFSSGFLRRIRLFFLWREALFEAFQKGKHLVDRNVRQRMLELQSDESFLNLLLIDLLERCLFQNLLWDVDVAISLSLDTFKVCLAHVGLGCRLLIVLRAHSRFISFVKAYSKARILL